MADIHIVAGDGGRGWRIVCHIPVPNTNNSSNVNWRTAVVNSGQGGSTELPTGDGTAGTISGAEKTQVETGELLEHSLSLDVEGSGADNASRVAAIRAAYTKAKTVVLAAAQRRLKYYGQTLSES